RIAALHLGIAAATAVVALALLLVAAAAAFEPMWAAALVLGGAAALVSVAVGLVGYRKLPRRVLSDALRRAQIEADALRGRLP
ncbi:MAG TPA: phage holin family protein, partial [Polyangiaceae bacterium]|nr:phage holin family protein [Polyangiaceae bacterium]